LNPTISASSEAIVMYDVMEDTTGPTMSTSDNDVTRYHGSTLITSEQDTTQDPGSTVIVSGNDVTQDQNPAVTPAVGITSPSGYTTTKPPFWIPEFSFSFFPGFPNYSWPCWDPGCTLPTGMSMLPWPTGYPTAGPNTGPATQALTPPTGPAVVSGSPQQLTGGKKNWIADRLPVALPMHTVGVAYSLACSRLCLADHLCHAYALLNMGPNVGAIKCYLFDGNAVNTLQALQGYVTYFV
jgi:hypothetical protein